MSITTLFPYTPNGMDLDLFLHIYGNSLKNKRVLYIVKPNLDPDIYKIGVAGINGGDPNQRLRSYLHYYGKESRHNPKSGVKIYYLGFTKYNSYVLPTKSNIYRKEKFIKDNFKAVPGRGDERFRVPLIKLINAIEGPSDDMPAEEQEQAIRFSPRLPEERLKYTEF